LTLKEVKGLKPHSKTDEYHARNNEQQKLSEGILKNVGQETVGGRRKAGYSSLNERTPPNSDEDFDHPKKGLRKVGVDHDTKTIKQESGDADEHMENAQVGAPGSHSQNPQKGENGTKASKYTRARGTKNKNDSVKNRAKDNHQDLDTIEKMDIDMAEFPTKKQKTGSDTAHAKGAAPEAATKTAGRAGSKAKKGIARPKTAPKVAKTAGSKAAKSGKDNNATMSAPPTRRSTRLARD
jgi:hypothetical protein